MLLFAVTFMEEALTSYKRKFYLTVGTNSDKLSQQTIWEYEKSLKQVSEKISAIFWKSLWKYFGRISDKFLEKNADKHLEEYLKRFWENSSQDFREIYNKHSEESLTSIWKNLCPSYTISNPITRISNEPLKRYLTNFLKSLLQALWRICQKHS